MDVHVTREVLADDAGDWLLHWQREGWTPVTTPVVVGRTIEDETVLRVTLSTGPGDQRNARSAPRDSDIPAWVPTTVAGMTGSLTPGVSTDRYPYDADVSGIPL